MLSHKNNTPNKFAQIKYVSIVAAIMMTLQFTGCGGGGGTNETVSGVVPTQTTKNDYKVTNDSYGIQSATYLTATLAQNTIVLRTAIASSMTDQAFRTIYRIDIEGLNNIESMTTYSLGSGAAGFPVFPGKVYFFNGHQSTLLKTVAGTILFSSFGSKPGDKISGTFNAVVEDGNSTANPKASYTISSEFAFAIDTFGAIIPATTPIPATAVASYDTNCASCHALGNYDQTANGASDLSLKGGELNEMFTPDLSGHKGITLTAAEIKDIKILLNAN